MEHDLSFLNDSSLEAARKLLGHKLVRIIDGITVGGIIVETEAYDQSDAASHSYKGRTPRTDVMFGPSGHMYVYFTYGMHYCCNVVTGPEGSGSAVLIRALEPTEGVELMIDNRGGVPIGQTTNGPAKLCQALGIDKSSNGHDLRTPPIMLVKGRKISTQDIVETPRIGITKDVDRPWRFYIKSSAFVSRK